MNRRHERRPARPDPGRRGVPLARALSKLGLATRTEARALILSGRIEVDGRPMDDPAAVVVPERIRVTLDGRSLRRPEPLTIALHKPRGVVTTRRDPQGRTTVYDLLEGLEGHVIPVGRLDYATSGLLLLTNDTRFADWLTDPANEVPRVYLVTVRGRVVSEDCARLERGVVSNGERLIARRVTMRKASQRETLLIVELVEGRNREIRRLMEAIGCETTRLRRVQIGGLTLAGLAPGAWRRVSADERATAFPHAPPARFARRRPHL